LFFVSEELRLEFNFRVLIVFLLAEVTINCKSDTIVCSNTLQLQMEDIAENALFKNVSVLYSVRQSFWLEFLRVMK